MKPNESDLIPRKYFLIFGVPLVVLLYWWAIMEPLT